MYIFNIILCLCVAVASFVHSNPIPGDGSGPNHWCISDADAATLVTQFESLFSQIDVGLADKILAPDFHQYSFSMNRPAPGAIPVIIMPPPNLYIISFWHHHVPQSLTLKYARPPISSPHPATSSSNSNSPRRRREVWRPSSPSTSGTPATPLLSAGTSQ